MADKLNYKVGMIGALDMLRFKNMPKVREKAIQAASSAPLPKTLTTNEKAKQRHPEKQEVIVAEIRRNGADAKTIVLKTEDGSALAPFRAGQYISVCVPIGGTVTTRSYSLCSSPAWAKRRWRWRFPARCRCITAAYSLRPTCCRPTSWASRCRTNRRVRCFTSPAPSSAIFS